MVYQRRTKKYFITFDISPSVPSGHAAYERTHSYFEDALMEALETVDSRAKARKRPLKSVREIRTQVDRIKIEKRIKRNLVKANKADRRKSKSIRTATLDFVVVYAGRSKVQKVKPTSGQK